MAIQEQFIVDAKGKKTGVILSLKQYQKLMEDLAGFSCLKCQASQSIRLMITVSQTIDQNLRGLRILSCSRATA